MIAGLDVLRIINEPTAAAIAYGQDKNLLLCLILEVVLLMFLFLLLIMVCLKLLLQ